MGNETLATELLRKLKQSNRTWFIAFIITLLLWISTVIVLFYYIGVYNG